MLIATLFDPLPKAVIWTAMLLLMGVACLANARRCRRTHCVFTGPFFIVMAAGVVAYVTGLLPLGAYGWSIIGGGTLIGATGIWWLSERSYGRFMG